MKQLSEKILACSLFDGLFDGGCKYIHFLWGEPGIIYLLWKGIPRKGRLLAEGSVLSRYFIILCDWVPMVISVVQLLPAPGQVQRQVGNGSTSASNLFDAFGLSSFNIISSYTDLEAWSSILYIKLKGRRKPQGCFAMSIPNSGCSRALGRMCSQEEVC